MIREEVQEYGQPEPTSLDRRGKLAIIEEARQAGQTVSEVCRRHGIATGQFYAWEKKARQGALEGLRAGKRKQSGREAVVPNGLS